MCTDQVQDLVAFFASFPTALLYHGNRASARAASKRTSICPWKVLARDCDVACAGSRFAPQAARVKTCALTLATFTRDTSRSPGSLHPAPGVRSYREQLLLALQGVILEMQMIDKMELIKSLKIVRGGSSENLSVQTIKIVLFDPRSQENFDL